MADPPTASMYSTTLLYQALLMAAFCGLFLVIWTRCCRRPILEDLSTPLLDVSDTPEHRIDAATKEAEAGFAKCTACSFDNFTRFTHCTICGEKLPVAVAADPTDTTPGGADPSSTVDAPTVVVKALSARQRRARKRREWTRYMDDAGELRWQRDAVISGSSNEQLHPSPAVVAFHDPSVPIVDTSTLESAELERVEDALLEEVSARNLVLTPALTADAALLATGFCFDADCDRRVELTRMAALDFPSKYAHFVVATASSLVPAEVEFLKLSVHRDFVLEESVDHLCCIQEKHIKSVMRITFLDESAVDAGGVHREWIMLLNQVLADSKLNLFPCRNRVDQSHYLNPNSLQDVGEDHLKYYFATGRLIGRVLLEGGLWGFHLSVPLLKIILGQPVGFDDLAHFYPETHKNLQWLLDNEGVDALALDFSVCEQTNDGQTTVVDLIADGRNVAVTDANKTHFVERKFQYLLFESVSAQLYALLKGIYEVVPMELLMLYDVEELDYLLCGTDEINVTDWENNTSATLNLTGTRVMRWFWEEVAAMPNEYRRRLLLFATGSSRVPLSGFRGLTSYDGRLCPFTLKGVSYNTNKYIMSHACFNRLDLPLYRSRSEMKTVLYAILDGDVSGFTAA